MQTKMAGGHFEKKNESCVFIWNDEKCKRKWILDIQNGRQRPCCEKKWMLRFHLNWREMQTKMNFRHPKWPPAAILRKELIYNIRGRGTSYIQQYLVFFIFKDQFNNYPFVCTLLLLANVNFVYTVIKWFCICI